ncbi:hypothetical protein L2E82_29902 [Cichorium intybus]|uniref:Uncharacterized protein n=1 Tax=Cichorium intybus TaxID=13427 RepID=A0ACB9CZ87_CICIN|nr:hypothetical protein L2E82_29902 [Cichorium intybus]
MAELAFAKQRSFKRQLMEAQFIGGGGGGGGNKGGGEIRRVHIVYYLSRNGRIEHPHLMRIHKLSHNGVYLRDVKSWLSELRGEDMPERFAWSYKRWYKEGYVWQDLLDDDLITPICDNEYVLKGSEISSTTLNNDTDPFNEREDFDLKNSPSFELHAKSPKYPSTEKEYPLLFSTNTSIEMEESSFASNVTTEDTTKTQNTYEDEVLQTPKDKTENNNSFNDTLLDKNTNDNNSNNNKNKKSGNKRVNSCFKASPLPTYSFGKSGFFSGSRASLMFRNWITCGTANTDEKAVVAINKWKGGRTAMVSSVSDKSSEENNLGQICKEKKLSGYEKSFDGINGSKKSKKEESHKFKSSGAAYKPVNGPNCSQCGRQFNPEKLHNHMKYCRGMKALAKSASTRPKPKTTSPYSASFNTVYLTNN